MEVGGILKKRKSLEDEVSPRELMAEQEREMVANVSGRKALMSSVYELARGISYSEPLWTGWKPPLSIRRMSRKRCESVRKRRHIAVDGDDVPPPITSFEGMRLPETVVRKLKEKGIAEPTPIQVQGLPVALSGRDMIGIASTGSGKTLAFVLPLVMVCLQEELMMPVAPREGPLGLIVCPSRELATQTYEVVREFAGPLRVLLCIGGVDMRSQEQVVRKGVHVVVATPGRLKDMLGKKEDES